MVKEWEVLLLVALIIVIISYQNKLLWKSLTNQKRRERKMKKSDLDSLIDEIENMSVEEYNKYHEEAKKMKKAYDKMIKAMEKNVKV